MGLVDQHDDVVTVVQDTVHLAELENRRDDELPGVLREQPFEIGPAVGLLQVRRVGRVESAGYLRVEVDPVDHDDHRRVSQRWMQPQLARREQHQQRLAGTLEVPDQALLGVAGDDPLDNAVRRLDLLVTCDDLGSPLPLARGVGRVAAQQIQNCVRAEHRRDGPLVGDHEKVSVSDSGSSGVILGLLTAGCRVYGYGTGVGGCAAAG